MASTTTTRLSAKEIAKELGIQVVDVDKPLAGPDVARVLGIDPDTWWGYVTRARRARKVGEDRPGLAPAHDGKIGRTPFWMPATIAAYKRTRPGQGKGGGRPAHRGAQ